MIVKEKEFAHTHLAHLFTSLFSFCSMALRFVRRRALRSRRLSSVLAATIGRNSCPSALMRTRLSPPPPPPPWLDLSPPPVPLAAAASLSLRARCDVVNDAAAALSPVAAAAAVAASDSAVDGCGVRRDLPSNALSTAMPNVSDVAAAAVSGATSRPPKPSSSCDCTMAPRGIGVDEALVEKEVEALLLLLLLLWLLLARLFACAGTAAASAAALNERFGIVVVVAAIKEDRRREEKKKRERQ
jgi:hypothetical protein